MVNRGLEYGNIYDTYIYLFIYYFSESTHSLVKEADMDITKKVNANQNEIC